MTTNMNAAMIETAVADVAAAEAAFVATNTEAKSLRADASSAKMVAYVSLIDVIIATKLKSGTKRAAALREALVIAGVSTASAKRFVEIGQRAARLPMITNGYDGRDSVTQALAEADIKTEAGLKAMCFPLKERTLIEKLVEAAKAGTETDDEAVRALLDAAASVNPTVQDVATVIHQQIAA